MDIIRDKIYDQKMIAYLKTLSNPTEEILINEKIRKDIMNAILNRFATFLDQPCPKCSKKLVKPGSLDKYKIYVACGNCGYTT